MKHECNWPNNHKLECSKLKQNIKPQNGQLTILSKSLQINFLSKLSHLINLLTKQRKPKFKIPLNIDVTFAYLSTHFYYQGQCQLSSSSHLTVFVFKYVDYAHSGLCHSKLQPITSSCNGSIQESNQSRMGHPKQYRHQQVAAFSKFSKEKHKIS